MRIFCLNFQILLFQNISYREGNVPDIPIRVCGELLGPLTLELLENNCREVEKADAPTYRKGQILNDRVGRLEEK
jgi:hypothetical protein